jgi:hypothetical protein
MAAFSVHGVPRWTIASGLLRNARRSRPFLTEQADNNQFRYYKGGLAEGVTHRVTLRWWVTLR